MNALPAAQPLLQSVFRPWVPLWLKVVVSFLILIPVSLANGSFVGSSIGISSAMGLMSEDINMAYYVTATGIAMGFLILPKTFRAVDVKAVIVTVLLSQIVLNYVCAVTERMEIIVICSFFIGLLKSFCLLETFSLLYQAFMPGHSPIAFYPFYRTVLFGLGNLSMVMTAELAYFDNWQHTYYVIMILLLIALAAVIACMCYGDSVSRPRWREIDWASFLFMSVCQASLIYAVTYGKAEGWFISPRITLAVAASVVCAMLAWLRQHPEKPFIRFEIWKNRSSLQGYALMFLVMFFTSANILITAYATQVLKVDDVQANYLNLYMLPGLILGGIIAHYCHGWSLRMSVRLFLGFLPFVLMAGLLYFQVQPDGLYEDLYILMLLRGTGLMVAFVACAIYSREGLVPKQTFPYVFFRNSITGSLGPAIFASLLTNGLYRLQIKNSMLLSYTVDLQNPLAAGQFASSFSSGLGQGFSIENAVQVASRALYNAIQVQAITVSIKTIAGWMLMIGLISLAALLVHFFRSWPWCLVRGK